LLGGLIDGQGSAYAKEHACCCQTDNGDFHDDLLGFAEG
jgi:hypothetical protein